MSELTDKMDLVREYVSIYDLLDSSPRRINYETRGTECQISCPFHGRDTHKSARVYPDTNSIYCWACAKGWDVISYWAEANEMWTDEGKLNYPKATNDLCYKFGLRTKTPDWKKKLAKNLGQVKNKLGGFATAPMEERARLLMFFVGRVSTPLKALPVESKIELWEDIKQRWDELERIDLESDKWRDALIAWESEMSSLVESHNEHN